MQSAKVAEQVEKILDTGEGDFREVFIQVGQPDDQALKAAEGVLSAIKNRKMAYSARELLPSDAKLFEEKDSPAARTELKKAISSYAANVAMQAVIAATSPVPGIAGLVRSTDFKDLIDDAFNKWKKASPAEPPREFLASDSVKVNVPATKLKDFVSQRSDVCNVFANRRIDLPTYVQREPEQSTDKFSGASTWGVEQSGALASWGCFGSRGRGTKIAVLDTGVDAQHPDLEGKVIDWAEFDMNGNVVNDDTPRDSDEHGTHVCGTIAGGNASGQWIGMAPEAELAVGLVLDGQSGTDAQILSGMEWAINLGVDAINMSLGGLTLDPIVNSLYSRTIVNALLKGIPVVVAIGNDGHQTTGLPGNDLFSFAVGAIDPSSRVAAFSGGRTQVLTDSDFIDPKALPIIYSKPELSAPGTGVLSCVPGGGWSSFDGTSMATPHVAGAIALLASAINSGTIRPEERAFILQDLISGSVDELGEAGQDHRYGFGSLNVLRALTEAQNRGFF